jgi:hypothetical protein
MISLQTEVFYSVFCIRYSYDQATAGGHERRLRGLDSGRGSGSGSPRGRKDSINSQGSQGSPRNLGSPSLQVHTHIFSLLFRFA